jgi:type IV pilus assembly protein PilC
MAQFVCRMAMPTGEIVERMFAAESEAALRRELEEKDFLLLNVRRQNPALETIVGILKFRARISSREFLFFNQEFAALLKAGLPILTSLDILIDRRKNATFKRALVDVRERVKSGEALSDAFAAQGDLFPRLYSSSLASGERSGELPTVLKRYIHYTRNLLAIQRKVVSAMIYPAIVLLMSAAVLSLMVFYIIPKFNTFLTEFGAELPMITRFLVAIAVTSQAYWKIILVAVVGGVATFLWWKRTAPGRIAFDRYKMRIPVVGAILHDYAQNRFTRTLGTLLSGGIPLVTSLDLSARAVGNAYYELQLLGAAAKVREGRTLWESVEPTGLVSDITVEMIKVGESTGALVEMLDNSSEFTEEEIDYQLTKLVTMIEPMMLVFLAVVVAGMLLAIYLPLLQVVGGQTSSGM